MWKLFYDIFSRKTCFQSSLKFLQCSNFLKLIWLILEVIFAVFSKVISASDYRVEKVTFENKIIDQVLVWSQTKRSCGVNFIIVTKLATQIFLELLEVRTSELTLFLFLLSLENISSALNFLLGLSSSPLCPKTKTSVKWNGLSNPRLLFT